MRSRDILLGEETLFSNEEAFSHDYVPEDIKFRDSQIRELAFAIKPALRGAKPSHSFLIGPTGTGKTTCAKHLFSEVKETTANVITVHVNCQIASTPFKILSEIHKQVTGILPPDTGIPLTKVQDDIFNHLSRSKKALAVALDDIIPLFSGDAADKVLYSLLRAHETYSGVKVAVFAISTEDLLHQLDDRVRSIFMPTRIEFHRYSGEEIFEILKERSRMGLYPDVITDALLKKIANASQDARVAIDALRKSALNAESDASRKISEEHVEKAVSYVKEESTKSTIGDNLKELFNIVKEYAPIESGLLFEIVNKKTGISYTTLYRMLQKLKVSNAIRIEPIDKKRGKTSLISVKSG